MHSVKSKNVTKDQRSYPRVAADIHITYTLKGENAAREAHSMEFSATGMSFPTDRELSAGTLIEVEMDLENLEEKLKTLAMVVRSWQKKGQHYTSIQFYDISYRDFIILLDYSLTFEIEQDDL